SNYNLWVGTIKGGLYLFKPEQNRFIEFSTDNNLNPLVNNNVRAIQEDSDGNLWVGTEQGLSVMSKKDSTIHNFTFSSQVKGSLPNNVVSDLFLSSSGKLWIGTGNGVCELVPGTSIEESTFRSYTYEDDIGAY